MSDIRILLVGHGRLPYIFKETAELLAGKDVSNLIPIGLDPAESPEDLEKKVNKELEGCSEALILIDLFGGTPCRIAVTAASSMPNKKIEVIAGVNLPLILQAVMSQSADLESFVKDLEKEGKESLMHVSKIA